MPVLAARLSRAEVHVCVVNKLYSNSKNFHLQNVPTRSWWFHQSPALLVSSWKAKTGQPNVFADAVQLEIDCLVRVEQLLTAHDCLLKLEQSLTAHPSCHPQKNTQDASADQVAAFIIHQALLSDTTDSRIVRLETDLFLLRTRNDDQMCLFSLFGKKCVPMQHALERAKTWDAASSQPNAAIISDIEAMMHVLPGAYNKDSWQHFFAATFETAAPLLATRRVLLRAGIAYFHADDVQPILKHLCAASLQRYTSQMQDVLFDSNNEQFALIAHISAQILCRIRAPDADPARAGLHTALAQDLRLDTIVDNILWNAPLCIRALLVKLKDSHATLYRHKPGVSPGLNYDERFVLRNFLQACGVERNVTLELFRQRSGLDDKSFHGKYGRDIHGSYNKQTKCFGCTKIQDKGLCPFQDKQRASQVLKTTSPSDTQTVDIEDFYKSLPSTPSSACVALYNKRHGPRKCVYSPRNYFLDARAKRVRIEQPKAHSDLPPPSLIPATAERAARIKAVSMGQLPR